MTRLVGLAGFAGSGKDTAAQCLIKRGYKRFAFADKIKEVAAKIDPLLWVHAGGFDIRWSDLDSPKNEEEGRRFLQSLGQAMFEYDPMVWVRPVENELEQLFRRNHKVKPNPERPGRWIRDGEVYGDRNPLAVITDVRRPIEVGLVKGEIHYLHDYSNIPSGIMIWVSRPGVKPCNGHVSESEEVREVCDFEVVNDGTVEELWSKVLGIVGGS